jgi:hypothetical protein
MKKAGAIVGIGLFGVLSVIGRAGDDIARLIGKGAHSADEVLPAVTHADDFYTPGVVRHSDDAGNFGLRETGEILIDEVPGGIQAIMDRHNDSDQARQRFDPTNRIDPYIYRPPNALPTLKPDRTTSGHFPTPIPHTPFNPPAQNDQ